MSIRGDPTVTADTSFASKTLSGTSISLDFSGQKYYSWTPSAAFEFELKASVGKCGNEIIVDMTSVATSYTITLDTAFVNIGTVTSIDTTIDSIISFVYVSDTRVLYSIIQT